MSLGNHETKAKGGSGRIGFSRLRAAFVLVGLLSTVPLLLALVYFSNQQRAKALAEAHEHLEILTAAYATSSEAIGDPLSGALGDQLFNHAQFLAFMLDAEDRVISTQTPDFEGDLSPSTIATLESGTASGEPFFHEIDGEQYLFARTPTPGGSLAFVGLPAGPIFLAVDEEIRRQTFTVVAVYLTSVLIGLLGSEVLIFGPLSSLSQTALALRSGDLAVRSRVKGVGEVAELATAMDRLAASVQDRQARLEQARAQAEQARRQADIASGAKTDFLASMSHEIRTPLHSIVGHTELLLEAALPPRQRAHAKQIEAGAQAVLDIVNDVLDLAVIEAGKIRINHRPLVLADLVNGAISIVKYFAERKGLELSAVVDPELPTEVVGDEARIRQVLLNFLNNAVKFTSEGSVTLEVRRPELHQDDLVEFSVIDTGTGIPIQEQHRLFQRFSQIGSTNVHGGAGLGLSISKRLVEEMGGTVGFRSEPQRGTTFWARLPLPASATPSSDPSPVPAPGSHQLAVLVADDVQMNTEIARAALETAGHIVDVANNGEEAVSLARKRKYDVILMDVRMSPLDGLAASRIIREDSGPSSSTTIIAMTANVLPDQIERCRAAGMDDHIGKPFARAELLNKLNAIAANSPTTPHLLPACETAPDFDSTAFEELASLLNEQQLSSWLEKLRQEIGLLLAEHLKQKPDRAELVRLSHGLVSHAGSMGFVSLAQACRELEEACLDSDADIGPPCAAARSAAKQALEKLPQ